MELCMIASVVFCPFPFFFKKVDELCYWLLLGHVSFALTTCNILKHQDRSNLPADRSRNGDFWGSRGSHAGTLVSCLSLVFCFQTFLLGVFEAVANVSESQRFDGSISLQTLNFYFSYEDVLFYFKWWTYLITVPPTSCFVGIERKLRSVAELKLPFSEE